jgi:hypothetical protein
MPVPRLRLRSPAWLRWPRRTARLRFTTVYGGLFVLSGAALLAITYVLFERATEYKKPQLPRIPHTPAIQALQHLPQLGLAGGATGLFPRLLPQAAAQLLHEQYQLAQDQTSWQRACPRLRSHRPYLNCRRRSTSWQTTSTSWHRTNTAWQELSISWRRLSIS